MRARANSDEDEQQAHRRRRYGARSPTELAELEARAVETPNTTLWFAPCCRPLLVTVEGMSDEWCRQTAKTILRLEARVEHLRAVAAGHPYQARNWRGPSPCLRCGGTEAAHAGSGQQQDEDITAGQPARPLHSEVQVDDRKGPRR